MLEMAGNHSQFIREVFYIYNDTSPINDHKIRHDEQVKMDQYIRKMEKYVPLPHLITTPLDKDPQ